MGLCNGSLSLTCCHVLKCSHHQTVIDMPYHPLYQCTVSFGFPSNVGENLGESVATNGGGMDQHVPSRERGFFQNIQNLQPITEAPSRPQEVHHTALNQEDIHATFQVEVTILSNSHWLSAEPREEDEKRARVGGRVGLI